MVNFVEETEEVYVVPLAEGHPAASLVMVALGGAVDVVGEEDGVVIEEDEDAEEEMGIEVAAEVDPVAGNVDKDEVGKL